jgi:hypothetical protein
MRNWIERANGECAIAQAARAACFACIAATTALLACGTSTEGTATGQLMLVIDTDMALPKDIDAIRVEVMSSGALVFGADYTFGAGGAKLPATLAILSGKDPSEPVTLRVIGKQALRVRTVREAVTSVPTDRIAMVRLPIAWLCDGLVTDAGATTSCPSNETCVAGRCTASAVDASTLPVYREADVFGGGSARGEGGVCFDTTACFEMSSPAALDPVTCTIPVPKGAVAGAINLALVPAHGQSTDGICGASNCLIPLDGDIENGWATAFKGDLIALPTGVCDAIRRGKELAVVTSSACTTKVTSRPTCGPWSAVSIAAPGTRQADAGSTSGGNRPNPAPPMSGKISCPDARLSCDTQSDLGCCWETGNGGPVYRCAGPSNCGGLLNTCDGNEDCAGQVCCLAPKNGASCRAICDAASEGERCTLSAPAGTPNGCPTGKTCKGCATRLKIGEGFVAVPICVAADTCPPPT